MTENEELKITVPLELSVYDIKMLTQEMNDTENSDMSIFIENLLKEADKVTQKLNETAQKVRNVNPFSAFSLNKDEVQTQF